MKRACTGFLVASVTLACDPTGPESSDIRDDPAQPAWAAVSTSTFGTCGLTADGSAFCWGFRVPFECEASSCAIDMVPARLTTDLRFASVDVGDLRRCAFTASGDAYCWGQSSFNETLGDGATSTSSVPIRIPFAAPVKSLEAGFEHACALVEDGTAYCWGFGAGKLGDGDGGVHFRSQMTPGAVVTDLKFSLISSGTTQTCAIAVTDEAYCWGGGYGTLGIGTRDTSCAISISCFEASTPQLVAGGLRWKSVSAGNAFTCGITLDDRGYCWGAVAHNGFPAFEYVLGSGRSEGTLAPVEVAGEFRFRQIVAGVSHACGLTLGGEAFCWGQGAIGNGNSAGTYATPQRVLGKLRFESLAAGVVTCGVSVNHNLYCWGVTASGRLGNGVGAVGMQAVPTRVLAPTN